MLNPRILLAKTVCIINLSYFHNELFLNVGSTVHITFIIRMLFSKASKFIDDIFGTTVY